MSLLDLPSLRGAASRSPRRLRRAVALLAVLLGVLALYATLRAPAPGGPRAPAPAGPPAPAARAAPRVVVVVIDALRADRLSFYGYQRESAPFLAELAMRSAVFEHAYAASTWTPSSVASLFTGLYPNQHNVRTGYAMTRRTQASERPLRLNRIPDAAPTLAELMRRRGYRTFGVSANLNFSERTGFQRGFDAFVELDDKSAAALNDAVLAWRDQLAPGSASFLYVHYMDTHKPYVRHPRWFDPDEPNVARATYESAIGYVDQRIRELYRKLRWDQDTLLVLTADHGEEFRDHGRTGHKNTLYAELLRVPLLLSWPGEIAPRRIASNVSLVDVLPTLEAMLPGDAPATPVAGVSLVPLLEGGRIAPRSLYAMRWSEFRERERARKGVLRGRWKYVRSSPSGREELYDMRADPRDLHDLAPEEPGRVAKLRRDLDAFEADAPSHARVYGESRLPARELAERLRALGYVR